MVLALAALDEVVSHFLFWQLLAAMAAPDALSLLHRSRELHPFLRLH